MPMMRVRATFHWFPYSFLFDCTAYWFNFKQSELNRYDVMSILILSFCLLHFIVLLILHLFLKKCILIPEIAFLEQMFLFSFLKDQLSRITPYIRKLFHFILGFLPFKKDERKENILYGWRMIEISSHTIKENFGQQ